MQKDLKQNSIQRFLTVRHYELDCLHYFSYILSTVIHAIENVTYLTLPSRGESINLYFLFYYVTIPTTEIANNVVNWWKNQLDATYYFIVLLIGSTCFGHYYDHHQELTTLMLITTLVVSILVCCRLELRCS